MKMIGHQAPGKNITDRFQIAMTFTKKVKVILLRKENCLLIISSVVNMIYALLMNVHDKCDKYKFMCQTPLRRQTPSIPTSPT